MEDSSASWLKRTLMRVCYEDASEGLQLDPDTVSSLVSYCELAAPADAAEYLINIVGHESCTEIVEEYLKRRTSPPSFIKNAAGTSMQAYQKPQTEDTWSVRNKDVKATKQSSDNAAAASSSGAVSSLSTNVAPSSSTKVAGPKKEGSQRGKRGAKAVSMAEASKLVLFSQGKPCDCQASRHELISNCLSCGKIVCKQEGEGPCTFCGALVLRQGSNYAGLEEDTMPASEAEAAAHAFKDRLVEYDRNSASRTTVIDDQSDFFEIDGNVWASEEEKQLLLKKQEEMEKAEEERKKRVVVTIDLLGRKVVMAGGEGAEETSILLGSGMSTGQEKEKSFRVKASPYIREPPVYTNTGQSRERGRKSKSSSGNNLAITGRVQYDDHFIEALLGRKMELLQIDNTRNEWQKPSLTQASSAYEEAAESFECA